MAVALVRRSHSLSASPLPLHLVSLEDLFMTNRQRKCCCGTSEARTEMPHSPTWPSWTFTLAGKESARPLPGKKSDCPEKRPQLVELQGSHTCALLGGPAAHPAPSQQQPPAREWDTRPGGASLPCLTAAAGQTPSKNCPAEPSPKLPTHKIPSKIQ